MVGLKEAPLVAVTELQRDHFIGSQSKPCQDQEDGSIAQSDRCAEVAAVDRPLSVVGRDRQRKRGRGCPGGHRRHRSDEFGSDVTSVLTEAQERSHCGDDALEAGWPKVSGLASNEIDAVAGNDRAHVDCTIAEAVLEELPCRDRVPLDRR